MIHKPRKPTNETSSCCPISLLPIPSPATIYRTTAECEQGIPYLSLPKSGRPKAQSRATANRLIKTTKKNRVGASYGKLARRFRTSYKTELGFGLTVKKIRSTAYELAKTENEQDQLNNISMASKWWCASFKSKKENLSAYRASMGNSYMINDYFDKLNDLLTKLGIKENKPGQVWNVDETGLSYVLKDGKIVTPIGKRYVYKRAYEERGETHSVVGCACADGTWAPPLIVFKRKRWSETNETDKLPNSVVTLSPNGWISSKLFIPWFHHFVNSIPSQRPVVLLLDSHGSYISPTILSLARENQIYLLTLSAHCSHLLQPLDVGVYRSLKANWRDAVSADALAPSKLTEKNNHTASVSTVDQILKRPVPSATNKQKRVTDSSAKCLIPVEEIYGVRSTFPNKKSQSKKITPKTSSSVPASSSAVPTSVNGKEDDLWKWF
ncbi:hypothetical protein ILUMI_25872 [Ignelater luminosus]|uniref:DDE-1 domain-containing protein n=1 Tax=Ignelater luminosus TaxID=2038154 RepID=A0A8K0C4B7_IGNLU|nr:hypothetical protein ILUMI_25872 [Ignelater luminosus]